MGRSALFAESDIDPARLGSFAFASRKLPEYMHYRLMLCGRCDVVFASPAPAAETLAAAYAQAAFDGALESRYAARTYGRLLRGVLRRSGDAGHSAGATAQPRAALDIGTGDGSFLRELQAAGFKRVVGVEPSAAPIAAAEADLRSMIRPGLFRAEDFAQEGPFDLITCFQTIEHLPDPLAMCRGALALLKPGGALVLVAHNRRALSARLLGLRSPIYDVEHLQLFSKRGIDALLRRAGFTNVSAHAFLNRYPLQYWTRLFPLPAAVKRAAERFLLMTRLGRLPVPLPAGNLLAVAWKDSSAEARTIIAGEV